MTHGCSCSSGTVFSVPPLFCSKTGARSFSKAVNFEKPGAARRARMLCGIFSAISLQSSLSLARAGQRGVAGAAAGRWVVGGATAGAAAGRTRGSQRPFTMRIFRALHLRTAARTAELRTQMPSTS